MEQIAFGTNLKARNNALAVLRKLGIKARGFTIRNQLVNGQWVSAVYFVEVNGEIPDGVKTEIYKLAARNDEYTLPKSEWESAKKQ